MDKAAQLFFVLQLQLCDIFLPSCGFLALLFGHFMPRCSSELAWRYVFQSGNFVSISWDAPVPWCCPLSSCWLWQSLSSLIWKLTLLNLWALSLVCVVKGLISHSFTTLKSNNILNCQSRIPETGSWTIFWNSWSFPSTLDIFLYRIHTKLHPEQLLNARRYLHRHEHPMRIDNSPNH